VLVNPVRKSSTFYREGSHGALNPVFAEKGIAFIPAASPDRSVASHGASSGTF